MLQSLVLSPPDSVEAAVSEAEVARRQGNGQTTRRFWSSWPGTTTRIALSPGPSSWLPESPCRSASPRQSERSSRRRHHGRRWTPAQSRCGEARTSKIAVPGSRRASSSVVLPIPASPLSSSNRPRPARASSTAARSRESSSSRPTRVSDRKAPPPERPRQSIPGLLRRCPVSRTRGAGPTLGW